MQIRQISIFLENKPNQLSSICRTLADAGVNVLTLTIADTSDFGIVRMLVDDADKARSVLAGRGCAVNVSTVVVVKVPDRPGGLANVLAALDDAGVNLEYGYAVNGSCPESALLALRFDDNEKAFKTLLASGFDIMTEESLREAAQ